MKIGENLFQIVGDITIEQIYEKYIMNLISERGRHINENVYFEKHHIIPKCIGGTDEDENLIDLYPEEHFIAHKLLAFEYPSNEKLVSAFSMMAFSKNKFQKRIELTPEEYKKAREIFSNMLKERWRDPDYREKQSAIIKKRWEDQDYREKQSEMRTRLNHQMWENPDFKESMREKLKNRWKQMNERDLEKYRNKMRDISNKLWNNQEYIRSHCTPIRCIETNEYFFKQKDAVQKYHINTSSLSTHLKGNQKYAGKHPITGEKLHWEKVPWDLYYQNVSNDPYNVK